MVIDAAQQRRGKHIRDILCNGRTHVGSENRVPIHKAMADLERRNVVEWDDEDLVIRREGLPYARHVAGKFDVLRGSI